MHTISRYLVCYILFLTGCSPSDSDFNEFARYSSPENTFAISVLTAQAKLPYGPTSVKINLIERNKDKTNQLIATKIANDGVPLSNRNIKANWINKDTLLICLSGDEQQDEAIKITISTASYTSSTIDCTKSPATIFE